MQQADHLQSQFAADATDGDFVLEFEGVACPKAAGNDRFPVFAGLQPVAPGQRLRRRPLGGPDQHAATRGPHLDGWFRIHNTDARTHRRDDFFHQWVLA